MAGKLDGRVAIVTGGGAGIGRGVARRFARDGAKLVIAEFDPVRGTRVAAELRDELGAEAISTETDVGDKAAVQAMVQAAVDAFGTVDILVNNAYAGFHIGRFENKTDALFEHNFQLNVFGPIWAMQAVFPIMRAKRYGRIINVCSIAGTNAYSGQADYNVSKEALRTLTRTAAREWAPHGIVANAVCPGARSSAVAATFAARPEVEESVNRQNPMGRLGDCEEDVAPVFAFLASEDARYMTGNTLFVDGGSHINGSAWDPKFPEDDA